MSAPSMPSSWSDNAPMPKLTIDNKPVEVPDGATILDAARKLDIEIPTLCFRQGHPANTTCMVCLVKIAGSGKLVPSCAFPAAEGMAVESETPEVHEARRAAVELLLSDHLGDCQAPCQGICPAHMDIPRMLRQIAAGDLPGAIRTVKADIALPAVLGRICPEICERGCRRNQFDGAAVSICLLKRYVADADLESGEPFVPACAPDTGRKVAVVGAGPAGLAAAYYLRQFGHAVTIFDEHDALGGSLRYSIGPDKLPVDVVDRETALLARVGWTFRGGVRVGRDIPLEQLRQEFDAVFLGVGKLVADQAGDLGLPMGRKGLDVGKQTQQTKLDGVYAGGDAVRAAKLGVMSVADGKAAACEIDRRLGGAGSLGTQGGFSVHIGRLQEGEAQGFAPECNDKPRCELPGKIGPGFRRDQAVTESNRCLHCDCRKPASCRLRHWAAKLGASPTAYRLHRRSFKQQRAGEIVYEPGKCIACGICLQVAAEHNEQLGLTWVGRGYSVHVGAGFSRDVLEGIARAGAAAVVACPTAALSLADADEG